MPLKKWFTRLTLVLLLPSNTFLILVVCCECYPFDLDLIRLSYDHRKFRAQLLKVRHNKDKQQHHQTCS